MVVAIFVNILIVKTVLCPAMVKKTDVYHMVVVIFVSILIVKVVLGQVMVNQTDV